MVSLGPYASATPREPPAQRTLPDPWLDIDLLECLCLRCQHGGECRSMRKYHAERAAERVRREQLAALTDEDRAWLTQHGWDGR